MTVTSVLSVKHCNVTLPFADVIGCFFGEHPLLEHVVECMNRAQLQSLLLMKHFSVAHANAKQTQAQGKKAPSNGKTLASM